MNMMGNVPVLNNRQTQYRGRHLTPFRVEGHREGEKYVEMD